MSSSSKSLASRWEVFDFKKSAPPPNATIPQQVSISATRRMPLPTVESLNQHLMASSNSKKLHLNRKQAARLVYSEAAAEGSSSRASCLVEGDSPMAVSAGNSSMMRKSLYMDVVSRRNSSSPLNFRNRMETYSVQQQTSAGRNSQTGKLNALDHALSIDSTISSQSAVSSQGPGASSAATGPVNDDVVYAEYEEYIPGSGSTDTVQTPNGSKLQLKKQQQSEEMKKQVQEAAKKFNEEFEQDPEAKAKHEKAALNIQSIFRVHMARKVASKMRRRKATRANNAKELLSTERGYVKSLDVLREVYFLPLQEKLKDPKPLITPAQFKLIFGHLETIHRVNKMFLDECEKVLANYSEDSLISSVFHGYTHLFKSYTAYCNNFDAASAAIKQLKASNQEFAAWLKIQDRDSRTNRLGLQSYLILPIQRIPRYRLLLQDILKHTDPSHKDYDGLKNSLSEILSVANHLNSTMKQIEASIQLLNIQSQFQNLPDNFEIQAPWRTFIKEGSVRSLTDQQNVHLHLFSDMLVISRKTRSGQFSYKNRIELSHMKIYDFKLRSDEKQNDSSLKHRFKIKSINLEMELTCSSEKEKYEWLDAIHEAIEQAGGFKLNVQVDNGNEKTTFLEALDDDIQEELDPEECLEEMKTKGATMLKYCRTGKPHFRHFVLSSDEKKICWGSKKKRVSDSKVLLSKVTDLRTGQTTDLFKKYLNPDVESESWSLLYGKGRSLDLVASDRRDFTVWITGLRYLLQNGPRANIDSEHSVHSPENNIVKTIERSKFDHKFQEIGDSYTWGQCVRGSLGHGDEDDQYIPLVMKDFLYLDVLSMYCTDSIGFGIMTNGALFSWGAGKDGRTGHGDENDRLKPTRVEAFRGKKVTQVASGSSHTLVLLSDGTVHSFGNGEYGQLGNGECKKGPVLEPHKIEGSLENHHVVYISCGSMHCAAVTNNGEMYVWGKGEDGQLGLGNKENVSSPSLVHVLNNESVVSCALGMWHTMALTVEGRVYVWGDTTYGQCGLGEKTQKAKSQMVPMIIGMDLLPRKIAALSAGSSHSGAIAEDGSVWMWGNGMYGQLGNGEKVNTFSPVCVRDLQHEKAIQITCGVNHTMVLTESNGVYAWGAGTYGRLGIKEEKDQPLPRLIEFLREKEVREISAGGCMSACVCAHQWVPDFDAKKCMACNRDFTIIRRRHHCRYCGGLFCGACSSKKITLLRFGFDQKVRVCAVCYQILQREKREERRE